MSNSHREREREREREDANVVHTPPPKYKNVIKVTNTHRPRISPGTSSRLPLLLIASKSSFTF